MKSAVLECERSFVRINEEQKERLMKENGFAGGRARTAHRSKILRAACALFRHQGYHGTSTRQIAEAAGVSLGNIYNHFPTKERLFAVLLEEYEREYFSPDQPLMRVFAQTSFPDNIEALGEASRKTVEKFADYMRLIYVDMIEFDAKHIGRLFAGMRERYGRLLARQGPGGFPRLAPGIDPVAAMMTVVFAYYNYFIMEKLFDVKGHYGMDDARAIRHFAEVFRNGILPRRSPAACALAREPARGFRPVAAGSGRE